MITRITRRKTAEEAIKRKRTKCIRKFLYYFPGGFTGQKYIDWERDYKWNAHLAWQEKLHQTEFKKLLQKKEYGEIARRAVSIESRTNLLFSFEKMAIRDAVKTHASAKLFTEGLYEFIHGKGELQKRFENYRNILAELPVKQTRVLTWPLLTVFGFIADPDTHIFLKPTVTKAAAKKYLYDFKYHSKPSWEVYESLLAFAATIRKDVARLKPRDMIDIQSFIWVLGSEEYPD